MTVSEAFAALLRTKYNATNLADPDAALDASTMAWMQAVTDAITTGTGAVLVSSDGSVGHVDLIQPVEDVSAGGDAAHEQVVSSSPATIEQNPAPIVTQTVETPAPAVENSASDAAPSSSEPATIAPQAPV